MGSAQVDEIPVPRDAASLILIRDGASGPEVLMGQRGAGAAFMPSKFVFPGGAVDPEDAALPLAAELSPVCAARLTSEGSCPADALVGAALREMWEEAGLALGRPGKADLPPGWEGFAARGVIPSAVGLRYIFRAVTPPARSRRFDARFFLARAEAVVGDTGDFSAATDELSHLHWLPLTEARRLDLPFITEIVLAEVAQRLKEDGPPPPVPFFDNTGPRPVFRRIA